MRPKRTGPLVAAGISLFISCGDESYVEYWIFVGNIDAPEWIEPHDDLNVTLEGTVGPDGCHRVARVETVRGRDHIDVTVFGQQYVGSDFRACSQEAVPLEKHLAFSPPFDHSAFAIVVHQPDGTSLRRLVSIRE